MVMFMFIYRVFTCLLLLLVIFEVAVEQATQGPLRRICTTTLYDEKLPNIPPLAKEDEDVINDLLGCSGERLSPSCYIESNSVTCDCYPEDQKRCRVVYIDFSYSRLQGVIPAKIGNLQ
ncbi:hypothetical protein P3S68_003265 [Capsicum galapagoense]